MDIFDEPLSLEQKFYDEGYKLGSDDGAKAGRIEGRVFGLEKGFEKYVEAGRLHGKSVVWASRLPGLRAMAESTNRSTTCPVNEQNNAGPQMALPDLANNPRLEKHVRVLYALTEPVSLGTENTEDTVSDFDDRLKRALAKVKIIERLIGEDGRTSTGDGEAALTTNPQHVDGGGETNIEDVSVLKARH